VPQAASNLKKETTNITTAINQRQANQALRMKRLLMSCGSYIFTFTLICFCWLQGMLPGSIVLHYAISIILLNIIFFVLIKTNINLKFAEPSMTLAQVIVSIVPPMYVMYFLDSGQARAVFLYLGIVPALYGILALSTRQFLGVAVWYVLNFSLMLGLLALNRPTALNASLDLIQLIALISVMTQMAWIGGYISELRSKLRKRNLELQTTTEKLGSAVEQIGELARRDELTGLYNRRHLFEVLGQECNRIGRQQGTFSICIADIDFFKQINDEYGHQIGDIVLRKVALSLEQSLRNIDCVGRYGGEEFLIILAQTKLDGAKIKAERVRQQIENLDFTSIDGSLQITVSIGIAEHNPKESIDKTILRSDEALYRAKNSGRNKTLTELDH